MEIAGQPKRCVFSLSMRRTSRYMTRKFQGRCPDFKTSNLGTCKHIEWTFRHLHNKRGTKKYFKTPRRAYRSRLPSIAGIGTEAQTDWKPWPNYFDQQGVMHPHAYLDFEHFWKKRAPFSLICAATRMPLNTFCNKEKILAACEDLKNGDLAAFGLKMYATHEGLTSLVPRPWLSKVCSQAQSSTKRLDFQNHHKGGQDGCSSRRKRSVLGARMMGYQDLGVNGLYNRGGRKKDVLNCTIDGQKSLVHEDAIEGLNERLAKAY